MNTELDNYIKLTNYINSNLYKKINRITEDINSEYNWNMDNYLPKQYIYIKKESITDIHYINKYIINYNNKTYEYYIDNLNDVYKLLNNTYEKVGIYEKDINNIILD